MSTDFDIIIGGAGPAGLMAGIEACQAGARTLLLERKEQIGNPVHCAEGVTFRSISPVIDLKPEWILTSPHIGRLFAPDGSMVEVNDTDGGYLIDRAVMETDLARQFELAGGSLLMETRALELKRIEREFESLVIEKKDGSRQVLSASVFIAADGVESSLARMAGIDNRLDLEKTDAFLQYRLGGIALDPNVMEIHLGSNVSPGSYAWVFPRSDNQANVGLGLLGADEVGRKARDYLDRFVERKFPKASIERTSCGTAPRYAGEGDMALDNLLIVGDAARLVDSLTGAGICLAMESGRMAGAAAARYALGKIESPEEFWALYPGQFIEKHARELRRLRQLKIIQSKLKDDELSEILASFSRSMNSAGSSRLDLLGILISLIKKKPRLIRLARHLV